MPKKTVLFQLFTIMVLFIAVPSAFGKWQVVRQDDIIRDDGVEGDLKGVSFVNETIGWAVGTNKLILKTIDGGKSWVIQDPGMPERPSGRQRRGSVTFWNVKFKNENEGFIIGSGVVLQTKDGGQTWKMCESEGRGRLLDLCMADEKNGAIVGENNTQLGTVDGGLTWNAVQRADRVRVGESRNNLESVFFATEKLGWIVGSYGTMMQTKDGGKTWTAEEPCVTNNLFSIFFVDENEGWIAGQEGIILHTTDAGQKWEAQKTDIYEDLSKISFVNKKLGWAVGDYGTVMETTDGGKTWKRRQAGNSTLRACSSAKPNHCWAVGDFGVIVKYVPE